MRTRKQGMLYSSSKNYFAGPDGMKNEVTMWFAAGGILAQELSKQQFNTPFGGLKELRGSDVRKKIDCEIEILDVCSGPAEFPNHLSVLLPKIKATCVDVNERFMNESAARFHGWTFIKADTVSMRLGKKYKIITASSAYHHIPDRQKLDFLRNLKRHLSKDGFILMCDNFIPSYRSLKGREKAVNTYYKELKKYFQQGNATQKALRIIEGVYLQDISQEGEYKTSFTVFKNLCLKAGLTIKTDLPVWQPTSFAKDNAGSRVLILEST